MPRVSIQDTEKTFEVKEGDVIYNALSEQGEELPHGCLSGSCGACRVIILEGKDNLVPPGAVETNTIEAIKEDFTFSHGPGSVEGKEIRLACRARVTGDVRLKPFKG